MSMYTRIEDGKIIIGLPHGSKDNTVLRLATDLSSASIEVTGPYNEPMEHRAKRNSGLEEKFVERPELSIMKETSFKAGQATLEQQRFTVSANNAQDVKVLLRKAIEKEVLSLEDVEKALLTIGNNVFERHHWEDNSPDGHNNIDNIRVGISGGKPYVSLGIQKEKGSGGPDRTIAKTSELENRIAAIVRETGGEKIQQPKAVSITGDGGELIGIPLFKEEAHEFVCIKFDDAEKAIEFINKCGENRIIPQKGGADSALANLTKLTDPDKYLGTDDARAMFNLIFSAAQANGKLPSVQFE